MTEAVIFDMDGLLIDSEPFWVKSEMEVYASLGVILTTEMCRSTFGMRIGDVTRYWHNKFKWDTNLNPLEQVERRIINKVIGLINETGVLFEGVMYILDFFRKKNLPLALASSSHQIVIDTVLDKFNIRGYFKVIRSGEFEERGKPNPAIYLNTAKDLNIEPSNCIAFEDSLSGLNSAAAAGMKTVAVPDKDNFNDSRFDIADLKLKSLCDFSESSFELLTSR